MPRPKQPKAKQRTETIQVKATAEQKALVERKARNRGLSASSFLLNLAIAAPEDPAAH